MYFIAVACVANIGLDYLFIGAMRLGAAGAALGTTLAQAVSVGTALLVIGKRKTGIVMEKAHFKPKRPVLGNLLKIGVPIAVQDGLIQVAFLLITIIANRRGLIDAAAVGIVEKIIGFVFLVPSSLLAAVSALGAQNFGAHKPERAVATLRYAIFIALGFGFIVSGLVQLIAEPVVGLFTNDSAVQSAGGQYFRGYIWDCIFAGIHFSFSGYFCACEKSILSFLHNIIAIALVRIPGVYLTSKLFPATLFPMGLATAAGSLLSVIICVIAFAVQMTQNLEGLGFTVVPFGQGYKDMSPPTKELLKLTLEGKLAHGGHPVLRWMVDNVTIRSDPAGNIKADKEKSTEKIDGAIATIMALDRAIRHEGDGASVYDERGLLFI